MGYNRGVNAQLLGIEIGGTKLQIVTGQADGTITDRRRLAVNPAAGGEGIRRQIAENLPGLLERWKPTGIGVGFGGPVDARSGRICRSHQIEGWDGFPLTEWLTAQTGLPAVVENDANTAAVGEARIGAGHGCDPVFYVTLGSGVGGGLAVNGAVYHGTPPGEAELGHVRLDRSGTTVESRCSGWAVDRAVRDFAAAHPATRLANRVRSNPGSEARQLGPALAGGDTDALRILEAVADDLAFGLSHVVHLMHPGVIVLGGGLSLLGEPLRRAVGAALPGMLMDAFEPGPEIRLAALGEDAVPRGALLLAGDSPATR
ncbi:MAG: ROK family protein [Verrucomicrobiales bacterium]|nr:ROK family protein [Verrucomicrobiales bacterium]